MPSLKMTKTQRFILAGTGVILYVPTMANYLTPTLVELNAGTQIQGELADLSGWSVTANNIDAPDWDSTFTPKVAGLTTADDSTITLYASKDFIDSRTLMPKGTTGYIVFMDGGFVSTTGKMDVFPISVASAPKQRTMDGVLQIMHSYAITAVPAENLAIP
jgi:hypothetical protein